VGQEPNTGAAGVCSIAANQLVLKYRRERNGL